MRYQYTGDLPAVTPWQHGQEGVTLTRALPRPIFVPYDDDGAPIPGEYTATPELGSIVIEPGDILELGENTVPLVHAHFEPLDEPESAPETEQERKAREKAEAKVAKPADASLAAATQDGSTTPALPGTGEISGPETGAQLDAASADADTTSKEG